VAKWLTEHFYRMGAAVPWPEKVRRATGRPLSSDALTRYLAGATAAGSP
jgi:Zn-dependent M32 family carboxypeptidase